MCLFLFKLLIIYGMILGIFPIIGIGLIGIVN